MDYQQNPNPGPPQDPNMQPPAPQYQPPMAPPPPVYGGGGYPPPPPTGPSSNGMAIAAMVLGIAALFFTAIIGWLPYFDIIPLVLSIVGLIISISARKKFPGDSKVTVGLVLSIIALVLSVIFFSICTVCITCLAVDGAYYYY